MKPKFGIYYLLTLIGLVVPSYFTVLFCLDRVDVYGQINMAVLLALSPDFYIDASSRNVSSQLLADIVISSLTAFLWMIPEARRLGMKHVWVYPVLTYSIAFSFALPLFFLMREYKLREQAEVDTDVPKQSLGALQ